MTTESMNPYPAYKDSGIEWIGEIPEGWDVTQLKRLCDKVTDGSHLSPETQDTGYPYITVQDVKETIIDFEKSKRISEKDYLALKRNGCQPKKDDVLLTKDGTIGRAVVIKENKDFVILSSVGLIRPSQSKIIPEYLRYYLISGINVDQMFSFIRGSALTRLTIKLIEQLLIAYPPISEQQSIATFLNNQTPLIDTFIENKQKQIELLKEERTAIINQAVTKGLNPNVPMRDSRIEWLGEIPEHWEATQLKRLCDKVTDGSHLSPETQDTGFPYITVQDIKETKIDFEKSKRISEKDYLALKRNGCQPKKDDVLLTKDGTIGKAVVIKENKDFVILSSVGLIRPNQSQIIPEYLRYYLISGINVDQMFSFIRGSALTRLTIKLIEQLLIAYPPISEQHTIVNMIDNEIAKVNPIMTKINSQITLLQEYRTALISEAVTGKIDLRNQHEIPTPK